VLGNEKLALKALYSRSLKSAQETASQIENAPSPDLYSADSDGKKYADLLQRDDIQALIIALPIVSQPAYIEAALTAGKHVLAEKPIAKDIATAQALIAFYNNLPSPASGAPKPIFAIAENFRFIPRFAYAAEQAHALGRITHFSVKVMGLMKDENKYYKTSWRTKPDYQGGFLLDGGVHHAAATRLFLRGQGNAAVSVRAFTNLTCAHLPPIDTVTAIVKTESGATGTYYHSAGSLMDSFEWEVACERGSVKSVGDVVTVVKDGAVKVEKTFEKTSGVREEVDAWAGSIREGKGVVVPLQSPEEALGDLEFLERMFGSGDVGGEERRYELQK
jgi:predicted dehydrogenase